MLQWPFLFNIYKACNNLILTILQIFIYYIKFVNLSFSLFFENMFSSIFNTCLRWDRYPRKSTLKLVHLFLSFSFSKYIYCLAYKMQ